MSNTGYHEFMRRGTPDFPIELYNLDENHPCYNMQLHWHKDYELIYITEGSISLRINGKETALNKHSGIFLPDGTVHGGVPNQGCKYQCLVFPAEVMYSVQKCRFTARTRLRSPLMVDDGKLLGNIFKIAANMENNEFKLISQLYSLFDILVGKTENRDLPPNIKIEKIKNALSYIEENYQSNITLSELSSVCSMSPNYFCRFFKELTNETPFEYITKYRINVACGLLKSELPVTDIALSCGFNDISYFINIFKKHMGTTPKQYKKSENSANASLFSK